MIFQTDLDNWFTYHPPSETQIQQMKHIRGAARILADVIVQNTPSGPDQSAAIRKLREAVMSANAAAVLPPKHRPVGKYAGGVISGDAEPAGRRCPDCGFEMLTAAGVDICFNCVPPSKKPAPPNPGPPALNENGLPDGVHFDGRQFVHGYLVLSDEFFQKWWPRRDDFPKTSAAAHVGKTGRVESCPNCRTGGINLNCPAVAVTAAGHFSESVVCEKTPLRIVDSIVTFDPIPTNAEPEKTEPCGTCDGNGYITEADSKCDLPCPACRKPDDFPEPLEPIPADVFYSETFDGIGGFMGPGVKKIGFGNYGEFRKKWWPRRAEFPRRPTPVPPPPATENS